MKKIFTAFLLSSLFINQIIACDICGCGVGNFNPFAFPHLSKNFFSLGYQHRYYQTHFNENGEEMNNREYYNTISFSAQYSPLNNLQLMVVVPFQSNRQVGHEGNKSLNRPGDIYFLANYKLIDRVSENHIRHTLLAGAGVKFATGTYHFDEDNEKDVANSNFQAGTGSTDYLINAFYSMRNGKIVLNSGINYKINTTNKQGYKFGNRMQSVTQLKYVKELGNYSFTPGIGISAEIMQQDKLNKTKIEDNKTGGYTVQSLAGVDVNTKKWALGVLYSIPVKQDLANGQIKERAGLTVHLGYSF